MGSLVDDRPEQPPALRQVADLLDGVRVHAGVDELGQPTLGCEYTQRGIARVEEGSCSLDDPAQHDRQREIGGDRLVRLEQATQPSLCGHDLARPVDELPQELVELETGQVRERQLRGLRRRPDIPTLVGRLVRGHPASAGPASVRPAPDRRFPTCRRHTLRQPPGRVTASWDLRDAATTVRVNAGRSLPDRSSRARPGATRRPTRPPGAGPATVVRTTGRERAPFHLRRACPTRSRPS